VEADAAFGLVRERGGDELAERLAHLDRTRASPRPDDRVPFPERSSAVDADVVFLGGGLSLLIAAELARLGARVIVLERARAGQAHREWNASAHELEPLREAKIFSEAELAAMIVARYREGRCHFHGGAPHVVSGVLDHAVDAGLLLEHVRAVAERRGVRFVDRASVVGLGSGPSAVRVSFREGDVRSELVARIAVDARGASSPYASADLVCPTVGGVMRGLCFEPDVGDILVTTEEADNGRQHVWEGFPGREGDLTVYLFYYTAAKAESALVPLYARFFETLGSFKRGVPTLVRPTFGFIPGWSRLTPPPLGPSPRVVLVGDAAARHSPLTFCGFGSMLRTFRPIAASLAMALERGRAPDLPLVDDDIHAWTGLLARLMASGALRGSTLNALLDDAFASLAAMGNDRFAALLQDRMHARDFIGFLRGTARRHPAVYRDVMRSLGPSLTARWGVRLVRGAFARRA
jgi:lycopene cyclase CruA